VSVRLKIILIVLPLLIVTLVLSSIVSSISARKGITRLAVELLAFKAQDLRSYLENQWNLLVANDLQGRSAYIQAAQPLDRAFPFFVRAQGRYVLPYAAHPERRRELVEG